VEGEILEGLVRHEIAPTADAAQLEVASRTDRGVHARANALLLTSSLSGAALLRALNGLSGEIFFSAARSVPTGFSVRTAKSRWYRYFEPAEGRAIDRWKAAAALFHEYVDVRSFGRDVPSEAPVWRKIDRVTAVRAGGILRVDLRAPSFVWRQVRKIVASLRAHDRGEISLEDLRDAIEGRRRLTLPMAEPERLVLWEVRYDEDWEVRVHAMDGPYRRSATEAREAARVRVAILSALWPAVEGPSEASEAGGSLPGSESESRVE
jgi:tRNA pseudouridine(38-40) synthase